MEKLKIAIQKTGRLSEKSLQLLDECGIKVSNGDRKLKTEARNFPMDTLKKVLPISVSWGKTKCGKRKKRWMK